MQCLAAACPDMQQLVTDVCSNGTLGHSTLFRAVEIQVQGVAHKVFTAFVDGRGTPPGSPEPDDRHAVIAFLCTIRFYFGKLLQCHINAFTGLTKPYRGSPCFAAISCQPLANPFQKHMLLMLLILGLCTQLLLIFGSCPYAAHVYSCPYSQPLEVWPSTHCGFRQHSM